ncbi:hypothetical protein NM208_g8930 [Fusarium decemcellulare]|uniref:Uncharacterized protein n=1 Tax=Fusarium decemcellulare TaxID=57161 RepID=A0ACC1S3H3_9HYPO|nr:hypothetical protein NM208_g8930 [Fusarium decemcellulare]
MTPSALMAGEQDPEEKELRHPIPLRNRETNYPSITKHLQLGSERGCFDKLPDELKKHCLGGVQGTRDWIYSNNPADNPSQMTTFGKLDASRFADVGIHHLEKLPSANLSSVQVGVVLRADMEQLVQESHHLRHGVVKSMLLQWLDAPFGVLTVHLEPNGAAVGNEGLITDRVITERTRDALGDREGEKQAELQE